MWSEYAKWGESAQSNHVSACPEYPSGIFDGGRWLIKGFAHQQFVGGGLPAAVELSDEARQPMIARVGLEPVVPVLRHLEVRNIDRQIQDVHRNQPGTGERQSVRDDDEMIRGRNHGGHSDGMRESDRNAQVDACGPE